MRVQRPEPILNRGETPALPGQDIETNHTFNLAVVAFKNAAKNQSPDTLLAAVREEVATRKATEAKAIITEDTPPAGVIAATLFRVLEKIKTRAYPIEGLVNTLEDCVKAKRQEQEPDSSQPYFYLGNGGLGMF